MLFARLVIEQNPLLQRIADDLVGNLARALKIRFSGCSTSRLLCEKWVCADAVAKLGLSQPGSHFQNVVSAARVAAGITGNFLEDVFGGSQIHLPKSALAVSQSTPEQQHDLLLGQRLEHIDASAREQRGINLERRIFSG